MGTQNTPHKDWETKYSAQTTSNFKTTKSQKYDRNTLNICGNHVFN
jgi:hypothetical protein